jgi:spore coat protein CotH
MSKDSIQNDPEIQKWVEDTRQKYLLKSHAIEFGVFLSNDSFDNFCYMSKELQEEIYKDFLQKNKKGI